MKIALLNDFKEYAGAEIAIKQRLERKPDNIEVDFKIPGDPIAFEKYDGFVLENVVMFGPQVLLNIIKDKPYIKVEHDFNFCAYRNQINCKGCDTICPATRNPLMRMLYENAKFIIAASPAHMQLLQDLLAKWNVRVTFGLPYTYEAQEIPEVERVPKTIAYLGTLKRYKGVYHVIELATRKPEYHFDIAGRHGEIKSQLPPNVSYIGDVEDKWKYLASHEYFIHLPQHLDPCPGTIIEAILAGCKLIYNPNVGTLSYPFRTKEEWVEALADAGNIFWERVTETFKKDEGN